MAQDPVKRWNEKKQERSTLGFSSGNQFATEEEVRQRLLEDSE